MGLPDSYRLPENYNHAYHLMGDGVAAPVVRYLSEQLFNLILEADRLQVSGAESPRKNPALASAG